MPHPCWSLRVRLRDSLSNPPEGLTRLVTALERAEHSGSQQVRARLVEAIVEQTGADDAGSVRLEAKENRKLSPDEGAALAEAYQAGESQRELARRYGMHEQTVRAHLRRSGVALRPVRVLSDEQEAEVARLYVEEQLSLAELATKFSVSASAVRSALIRRGVERRAQSRRSRTRN
jgi:transposase-like protein